MMNRSGFARTVTRGYQRTPGIERASNGVAEMGRGGDTMLAHVTPDEAAMLKRRGGAGTRNPRTGLPEFYPDSSGFDDRGFGAGGESARQDDARGVSDSMAGGSDSGGDSLGSQTWSTAPGTTTGKTSYAPRNDAATTFGHDAWNKVFGGWSGFEATPHTDRRTGAVSTTMSFNPYGLGASAAALATGPFAPVVGPALGALADKYGTKYDLGEVSYETDKQAQASAAGDKSNDPVRMGQELVASVLGNGGGQSEAQAAVSASPARSYQPYQGDPLTYAQPGQGGEHTFFIG